MFYYHFFLGLRGLNRSRGLTALMVLTLAIGVAASVTSLTILHMMSGDPIPSRSSRLFVPVIDNGALEGYVPGVARAPDTLTYKDAKNLLASGQGARRTALISLAATILTSRNDGGIILGTGIAPTHDFFAMFEVPFLYGQAWTEQEDAAGTDVVVLSRSLSQKLFGDTNPVNQRLSMWNHQYLVVGVIDHFRPLPRFYHVGNKEGPFGKEDEFMIPLASAVNHQTIANSRVSCVTGERGPGYQGILDSECNWIQFWFEGSTAQSRTDLQNFLDAYVAEQGKLGRLKRQAKVELFDVNEWLVHTEVVGNDRKMTVWLAFGFLSLCLINTIGLLMAKFSGRSAEVGVRRALGASSTSIFNQFLIESGVIGLAGGFLGLVLTLAALAVIKLQAPSMAVVAHMDWLMLVSAIVLSVFGALIAGLIPAWRACQIMPAWQLKSQ